MQSSLDLTKDSDQALDCLKNNIEDLKNTYNESKSKINDLLSKIEALDGTRI